MIASTLFAGCFNIWGDTRGSRIEASTGFGPATLTRTYNGTSFTFDRPMLLIDGVAGAGNALSEVSDLFFDGNNVAPVGVHQTHASHAALRNLRVFETTLDGLVLDAVQNCTFINLWMSANGRHNYRVINGLGWCSFFHCFGRFPGTTNLTVEEDVSYPGASYAAKAPKNLDIMWIGGLLEGERTAGQKTHCAALSALIGSISRRPSSTRRRRLPLFSAIAGRQGRSLRTVRGRPDQCPP